MSARNAEGLLAFASRAAHNPVPPSAEEMARFIDAAAETLAAEPPELRPRDSSGRPGGLVLLPDVPTVVLPDIHARPEFIDAALRWEPPWMGAPLARLLERGAANLVCLGDILHSEGPAGMRRWTAALAEYRSGWASHELMDEEMGLALAAARAVIAAKATFPAAFHWIKGNHDNIADEDGRGDHSFYKFAAEGAMTASWFAAAYGDELLDGYRGVETALPVLALGRLFALSHAEPAFALSREDAIEYRSRPEVSRTSRPPPPRTSRATDRRAPPTRRRRPERSRAPAAPRRRNQPPPSPRPRAGLPDRRPRPRRADRPAPRSRRRSRRPSPRRPRPRRPRPPPRRRGPSPSTSCASTTTA
jgi:hypothetical protein